MHAMPSTNHIIATRMHNSSYKHIDLYSAAIASLSTHFNHSFKFHLQPIVSTGYVHQSKSLFQFHHQLCGLNGYHCIYLYHLKQHHPTTLRASGQLPNTWKLLRIYFAHCPQPLLGPAVRP